MMFYDIENRVSSTLYFLIHKMTRVHSLFIFQNLQRQEEEEKVGQIACITPLTPLP